MYLISIINNKDICTMKIVYNKKQMRYTIVFDPHKVKFRLAKSLVKR
jgi:hypothetical protein